MVASENEIGPVHGGGTVIRRRPPFPRQAASQVGSADENDIAGYMSAAAQDWMIQPSSRRDGTAGVTVEASQLIVYEAFFDAADA
ncbi:hypothetical protein NKI12_25805 [Mesorhizobium australicum]|uniref:Uncharacterized protein n=1 Tax=Mesorhizobium australicum TaxID=536018 RepID=A0ACC6T896_9HYPH